jgi:hypothetical protein
VAEAAPIPVRCAASLFMHLHGFETTDRCLRRVPSQSCPVLLRLRGNCNDFKEPERLL